MTAHAANQRPVAAQPAAAGTGAPGAAALNVVGHKIESIYRHYSIDDEASLREAVAKLAALHKADAASARARGRADEAGGEGS